MTDELKPCPFCGDAPYTDEETAAIMGNRTGHRFAIACRNCEISASGASDMPAAIAAWNTRADLATPLDDPRVKALVDALEQSKIMLKERGFWDIANEARAALSALEENK